MMRTLSRLSCTVTVTTLLFTIMVEITMPTHENGTYLDSSQVQLSHPGHSRFLLQGSHNTSANSEQNGNDTRSAAGSIQHLANCVWDLFLYRHEHSFPTNAVFLIGCCSMLIVIIVSILALVSQ